MALVPSASLPRRARLVLLALFAFCVITWSPISPFHSGGRVPFLSSSGAKRDILEFVDPLIGTTNGGHVFPGATLPYGMAKACPDTDSHAENAAGFVSDYSMITGFSHMHDSGTGGSPSLGNFPLFPHPGCPHDDYKLCKYAITTRSILRVNDSTEASAGYFAINLTNTVRAEMTASEHAALYRFSFQPRPNVTYEDPVELDEISAISNPLILVDLIDLANSRTTGGVQVYPESGRVIGDGIFMPSFGQGVYQAYFCADFRGAEIKATGTFMGEKPSESQKWLTHVGRGFANPSGSAGAWLHFTKPKNNQIIARVGVSFISVDRACENAETEIPDFDFEDTWAAAEDAWSDKLSAIEVDATGVSEELQTVFWSGLYRSLLSPQNITGENPLWNSTEPYFDSFYCIWDSFRAQHPLLTIVDPEAQTQMVRALLDIYRFVGKLPDCRMTFCKGFTQGGSNADVVIADAYIKNITKGVNWTTAYEAVVSDAEVEPIYWGVEGRGNLESYFGRGYIAWDHDDLSASGPQSRTISRTLEYAYDDFCIAAMSHGLGHHDDYHKYMSRSTNWRNLWNPDQVDLMQDENGDITRTKYKGFMQPRYMNGTWKYQNTRTCSPIHEPHKCYFDTAEATYEGSPWLYSFFVPQDMSALIELFGGKEAFIDRLTFYHESGIVYMGNEQSFLPVFQFHYGARPGLSSYWTHRYIPTQFNATINGIPGNDDCAMGAFSAFAMMGFFPVAGQDVYLLTPPFFREVKIRSRGKHPAIIRKVGTEEDLAEGIYVQSARLNGKPYTRSWITHDFFLNGGILELTVGKKEGDWGTREEDLPPSFPVGPKTLSSNS